MLSLLLAATFSAQASAQIDLTSPASVVIPWLAANRDAIAAQAGCRVLERHGSLARVSLGGRDNLQVWVRETTEPRQTAVRYTTTLAGAHRKIKALRMETLVLGRADGGTSVYVSVRAEVYGLGERQAQKGIEAGMRRCEEAVRRVVR